MRLRVDRGGTPPRRKPRKALYLTPVMALLAVILAACSSSSQSSASSAQAAGSAQSGGTVTEGIVGVAPSYVFPMTPPGEGSGTNTERFNWLMYLPLYQVGNSGIDESNSLAEAPVYSDGDKTITITLKDDKWSNGEAVTSRDLTFFLNLAKANKDDWDGYTPGEFPDDVASYSTPSSSTLVVNLTKAYDPTWFTDDQLADWYALPQQAWDKTSTTDAVGNYDETTSGAEAVYKFLTAQSSNTATYVTNPLWKVVDGPWEIKSFKATTGPDVFTPNPDYPTKPRISEFVETIFTTDTAEFNALLAGNEINIGTIPPEDLPQLSRLAADYTLTTSPYWHIGFDNLNFKNPVTGPIVSQLYVRQALEDLEDQSGQVDAYLDGGKAGYAVYGPIPQKPSSEYMSSTQETDPYPYSVSAAKNLLENHGWSIPASGAATCVRPGTASDECGAGIPAGRALEFNFLQDTGQTFLDEEVANFKSDAAEAGVVLNVSSAPFQTVIATLTECIATTSCPASSWEMGTWNAEGYSASYASPYATGEWVGEDTNYSSSEFNSLLDATETSSDAVSAIKAYDTYVTENLPVVWTLTTYGLNVVSNDLKGVTFSASGYENTTDWYLSS
jgi:peptide/nickel transport system substrate-binding protein